MDELEPFELDVGVLRAGRSRKWSDHPDGVLPAWIADMDFRVAPPVQRAVQRVVEAGAYTYPARREAEAGDRKSVV